MEPGFILVTFLVFQSKPTAVVLEMARPGRFELPTSWFVAMRSIQLSYGRRVCPAAGPRGRAIIWKQKIAVKEQSTHANGRAVHRGIRVRVPFGKGLLQNGPAKGGARISRI